MRESAVPLRSDAGPAPLEEEPQHLPSAPLRRGKRGLQGMGEKSYSVAIPLVLSLTAVVSKSTVGRVSILIHYSNRRQDALKCIWYLTGLVGEYLVTRCGCGPRVTWLPS